MHPETYKILKIQLSPCECVREREGGRDRECYVDDAKQYMHATNKKKNSKDSTHIEGEGFCYFGIQYP